jgi:hypothetical protein
VHKNLWQDIDEQVATYDRHYCMSQNRKTLRADLGIRKLKTSNIETTQAWWWKLLEIKRTVELLLLYLYFRSSTLTLMKRNVLPFWHSIVSL